MAENLIMLISELKEEDALRITEERLHRGEDPQKILEDGRKAMQIVGERFSGVA